MRKSITMLLCIVLAMSQALAQNSTVRGKISDGQGNPIANASVQVKGTSMGTTTNDAGQYTVSVPSTARTLVITSLNFISQEISIGGRTIINASLSAAVQDMQEVVVVGYSTVNRSSLTGSVGKVGGKEVANRPVLSFDQALTGKAAGVLVNTSSGLIGDNVIIRIRGAASISSGSQPLIIMDGVPLIQGNNGQLYNPVNPLADINPNDIESVEVLKDASSAAIYGSRASGGVILITTKKGKSGKTSFTYDTYVGVNTPSRKLNVLDADQYVTVINQMRTNAGLAAIAAKGDFDGDGKQDNTNWQDQVYRNGFTQNHQVGISGGAGKTTFYASLGYNDFENYIIVNRQTRGSARLNINSKVNDWFEVGIKTQYSRTRSYGLGSGTGGALSGVPFGPLTAYPNVPVYDAAGNYYTGAGGNSPLNNTPNPVAVQNLNFDTRDSRRFIGSAFAELSLMKGLKFKTQYNIDYLTGSTDQYWDPSVGDGSGLAGVAQVVYNETNVWSWFNTLNYNTKIGDHDISTLVGAEYTRSRGIVNYASGLGLNDPLFRIITPANYTTVSAENGNGSNNGLASYFGGLNYGYQGKYLATFNIRADAYSGFGRSNRWGYFPSGSVAWKASREDFWKINFINDFKLRVSYGITGNSNIGDFPSLATFAPTQYADIPSLNLNSPGNPDLRWEQTGQFDIGFDAQIANKINIVFDYYKKKTKDLILNNPILATIGFPGNSIKQNIGTIETNGVELTVNFPVFAKKNFSWDISLNGAWNRNKVISTNTNNDDIPGTNGLARPGYDLGVYYLIRWAGVNPENGFATFLDVNGVRKQYDHAAPAASRWTKVSDKSVTTAVTATDRVLDNSKTPYAKFFGGISQSLRYKNFDLVLDIQYVLGHYLYNSTMTTLMVNTSNRNKSTNILNAWTKSGDVTDVPKLFWAENQSSQVSTRWLEKGDFARLRNLQIGFSLPVSILDKIKLNHLRIYGQIQNAFTITGYSGMDPEANANGNTNIGLGFDNFRPYQPRTFTFGINLGL